MKNDEFTMKKLLKKGLKAILPLIGGGCIMAWIYWDFDFSKVGDIMLHEMNWWWMIISLCFGVFSHIVRGLRWKLALAPLGAYPRTANCINAIFLAYAANLVLPRLGELSRCGVLSKYDHVSFSKSLGTVVTERLIDSLCVLLVTAVAFASQMPVFNEFFLETGTDIDSYMYIFTSMQFYIVVLCVVSILVLLYYIFRTLSFFEKVKGVVLNVWEGIISLKNVRNLPLFILYTILIWFFYFMQFYVTFYCFSFTFDLGVLAGLVLFVAGSVAVVVPTPNGAGPWHFAIISMMIIYGVNAADAGIFALIVHGIQTFLLILLGIYATAVLPIINKKQNL